jgi:hypothetical protein
MSLCNTTLPTDNRIVFLCDKLAVVNGANINQQISLKDFFVPVESVNQFTFVLERASQIELDFGNIATFLMIYPVYDDTVEQQDRWIEWSEQPIADTYYWKYLGNLLILTGNGSKQLESKFLRNQSTQHDVFINVLVGS